MLLSVGRWDWNCQVLQVCVFLKNIYSYSLRIPFMLLSNETEDCLPRLYHKKSLKAEIQPNCAQKFSYCLRENELHLAFQSHSLLMYSLSEFNVYGSVRRKNILIHIQQDATLHSLFLSGNCSICFGWYHHPSSGAQTTVSTASGTCQTVTATCR